MRVRLGEELYTTRLVEFLQLLDDLWSVELQLHNACTRQREGNLEILAMFLNHVADSCQGGHVRTVGDIGDAALVLVVVIVVMIGTDIEETIALQMDNLMYLEI